MVKKKTLTFIDRMTLAVFIIILTPIILLLAIMKIPVAINSDSDEPLLYKTDMRNFVYEGKLYTNGDEDNLFSSLEEAGIKSEIPLGYSEDSPEKIRFDANAYGGYRLEYIYDGNVKRVYTSRTKKL